CFEIVQTVAHGAERRFVEAAIDSDGAGRALDRGSRRGERDYRLSLQQPDQAGLVVAGQPVKTGLGVLWHGDQAEQVPGRPAEGVRLVTPAGQKGLAAGNGLLPALHRYEVGTPGLKDGDCAAIGVLFASALAGRPLRMRNLRILRILRRFRLCSGARFRRLRRFRVRMSLRDAVKNVQVSMRAAHWLAAL